MRKRTPRNLRGKGWIRFGDVRFEPTYVRQQQEQSGTDYQHYAQDANGNLLCCGVTRHERMNQAIANQIRHVWMRWRKEYIAQHPGNYPLAQCSGRIAGLFIHPIGQKEQGVWFIFQDSATPPSTTDGR